MGDMLFSKLPCPVKERLAMYLDCHNDRNWKSVAEILNCPVFQISAFEQRAHYSKDYSPSLVFFDQFCCSKSINVETFKNACAKIQNHSCVDVLESFIEGNGSNESIYGSSEVYISLEQKRLRDFDSCSQMSCIRCSNRELCNGKVPLSQAICRNIYGIYSSEKPVSPKLEEMESPVLEVTKVHNNSCGVTKPANKVIQISVFITYSPQEKNMETVLNICNFLKKNKISVSLDTNAQDIKGKQTEEWIKEKFQSVDNVILIATPTYKAATQQKSGISACFSFQKPTANKVQDYHISLIHSLMFGEHNRLKAHHGDDGQTDKQGKRFVCLLPNGSSSKDIPRWLRSSYPSFVWPNHYQALIHYLQNDPFFLHHSKSV